MHYKSLLYSGKLVKRPRPLHCGAASCDCGHYAKGLCKKHYEALRGGSVEVNRRARAKVLGRAREYKRRVIAMMGGACCKCGYHKNVACLHFHHLDPAKKDANPSAMLRKANFNTLMLELSGCILVCSNCHGEIHHPAGVMV